MKKYLFILCVLGQSVVFGQNTIVVDNNPLSTADYSDLQTAIDEATAGDFIYIQPSITSYGDVTVGKLLHLRGLAHYPEVTNGVPSELGTIYLIESEEEASGSSFSGLKFKTLRVEQGKSFNGIRVSNCHLSAILTNLSDHGGGSNWIVEGNIFVREGSQGIPLIDVSSGVNWIIHHNIFQETINGYYLINAYNNTTQSFNNIYISFGFIGKNMASSTFRNDIFLVMGSRTTFSYQYSELYDYQNCVVYCYDGQTFLPISGSGNLVNVDPEFVNLVDGSPVFDYENDYNLSASSAAKGAGTDGLDPGVYNGSHNFLQRGYAYDLPYISFIEVKNPGVAVGQTLEVEFKASGN